MLCINSLNAQTMEAFQCIYLITNEIKYNILFLLPFFLLHSLVCGMFQQLSYKFILSVALCEKIFLRGCFSLFVCYQTKWWNKNHFSNFSVPKGCKKIKKQFAKIFGWVSRFVIKLLMWINCYLFAFRVCCGLRAEISQEGIWLGSCVWTKYH